MPELKNEYYRPRGLGVIMIDVCTFHCIQALCHYVLTGELFRDEVG